MAHSSFVFVHIPRCGGTSFREYLYCATIANRLAAEEVHIPGFGGCGDDRNLHQLSNEELDLFRAKKTKVIASHDFFNSPVTTDLSLSEPYYFAFLRRPIDRFLSHYYFFYYTHGLDGLKGMGLEDLPDSQLEWLLLSFSNLQVRYISGCGVRLPKESDLEIAKENLIQRFASFGILEKAERSVSWLQSTTPRWLRLQGEFPRLNDCSQRHCAVPAPSLCSEIEKASTLDRRLYEFADQLFDERTVGLK